MPVLRLSQGKRRGFQIDPILISILLATTIGGVISLTAAAVFSFALLSKMVERLVSLSVGIMLSTSLLHALPEAFESGAGRIAFVAERCDG